MKVEQEMLTTLPKPQVIGSASMILRCPETGYQCTFTQSHNLAGCLVYKLNQCPSYCNGGGIDSCPATFDVNTHFCFLPQNCGHVFPQPEVTSTPFLGKYSSKKKLYLEIHSPILFCYYLTFFSLASRKPCWRNTQWKRKICNPIQSPLQEQQR